MNIINSSKSKDSSNNSDELVSDIFDTTFIDNHGSLVIISQDQTSIEQMSDTKYKTPENSIDHLENDNSLEKTLDLKSQVLEFLKDLQKIVHENKKRSEIFKKYQETSVSKLEVLQSYNSADDINLYMEEVKEQFVNSLNISYGVMREMDQNLSSKSFEIKNIRIELSKKNSEIEKLGKTLKNEKKPDVENKYKSLMGFEATNRKNQIHINQLTDDLKEVEKELQELKAEKRQLKNQIRQLEGKYEDKEYEYIESQEDVKKLTNENKKLKSSLKKYQNNEKNESESKEIQMQLEMKDKSIISLKNEINEKERKVNILLDSIREKESLQRDQFSVTEYIQTIESLREELEYQKTKMTSLNIEKENIEKEYQKLEATLEKVQNDLNARCKAVEILKKKVQDFMKIEKDIQENNRLNKKISSLEIEIKKVTLERDDHKNNFNEKVSECEKLKKEKFGLEKDIQNFKMLSFKKG